jgi:hypothetical protein
MLAHELNQALMKAIEEYDVKTVKDCLVRGANPNFVQPWDGDVTYQPNTPLRMVVFRISDNLLEDMELELFAEIATLLIQYGADPKPAIQLAELRYGKYDPTARQDPFRNVLRILVQAAH